MNVTLATAVEVNFTILLLEVIHLIFNSSAECFKTDNCLIKQLKLWCIHV